MITRRKTTLWGSSRCLSPAWEQVLLKISVQFIQNNTHCGLVFHKCVFYFFLSGYRHVHLLKADGSSLSPATLFIHVKVSLKGVHVKSVSDRMAKAKGKAWRVPGREGEPRSPTRGRRFCCCCCQTSSGPIYTDPLPNTGGKMSFIWGEEARRRQALSKWKASGWVMNPRCTVRVWSCQRWVLWNNGM